MRIFISVIKESNLCLFFFFFFFVRMLTEGEIGGCIIKVPGLAV
jgi:hypothetical protein